MTKMITHGFDWDFVSKTVEDSVGKGSFYLNHDGEGASIIKNKSLLASLRKGSDNNTLNISFRASLLPNTAAIVTANLSLGFKIRLDPYFEFGHDAEVLSGEDAVRYFAKNANWILFGERTPSHDSLVVRPKGSYIKHNFN